MLAGEPRQSRHRPAAFILFIKIIRGPPYPYTKWFYNLQRYSVSQKKCRLVENSHNYLQTHPKCKSLGCFRKFRIFATKWALRFSKLKNKWLRKWSLKLPTPPPKIGRINCSQYALLWWSSAFSWLAMKTKFDKLKKIFYSKPDAPVEVSVESAAASTVIYDCNGCNGNK